MSASLVGSEMCIRDRCACAVKVRWESPCARARIAALAATFSAQAPPSGPVSYTHLTLPTICSV
eukprot:11611552-Alexandrium_andersonii.AAC.1